LLPWLTYNYTYLGQFTLSPADGQYISIPLNAKEIGEPKAKRASAEDEADDR